MKTIIFIVSFLAILVLLLSKIWENKSDRKVFWHGILNRADAKIHDWQNFIIGKFLLYRKIARLFIFDFLPHYLFEKVHSLKLKLARKYNKIAEDFRGKRNINREKPASFFLEKLSEEKEVEKKD